MILQTISQVSKRFNISARTLRYYEQIGLLPSIKTADYAYRTYDENSLRRLQQIIILRKLRIPLKEIKEILLSESAVATIQSFQTKVNELDDEIIALSTIRSILGDFIIRLKEQFELTINLTLLEDKSMLKIIDSLTVTKINFKEEKSMEELNKANENLAKLKDVRIVCLPPATVAASHYIGKDPEHNAGKLLDKFVRESGLCKIKPDLRHYGFNHPNPSNNSPDYGYEMWITIPDDMEVPEPLVKKRFDGGLYAAHMIYMGNLHEWEWLCNWVFTDNTKYESNWLDDGGECMDGLLEEHINYINHVDLEQTEPDDMQLDLLFPIKIKKEK